jgi:hypothetical protein
MCGGIADGRWLWVSSPRVYSVNFAAAGGRWNWGGGPGDGGFKLNGGRVAGWRGVARRREDTLRPSPSRHLGHGGRPISGSGRVPGARARAGRQSAGRERVGPAKRPTVSKMSPRPGSTPEHRRALQSTTNWQQGNELASSYDEKPRAGILAARGQASRSAASIAASTILSTL